MSITIEEMQKQVHNLAREKGWWPIHADVDRGPELYKGLVNISEKLMLMSDELSEAHEHYRGENGIEFFYSVDKEGRNKPDGFGIELADCVIRIMDLCGAYDINLEELIKMKHTYNKTRPYRHGGKKC